MPPKNSRKSRAIGTKVDTVWLNRTWCISVRTFDGAFLFLQSSDTLESPTPSSVLSTTFSSVEELTFDYKANTFGSTKTGQAYPITSWQVEGGVNLTAEITDSADSEKQEKV